jgi:indolepyruvate ferredoxin oxidoreductase alpha subunit
MNVKKVLEAKENEKLFLLGNEAAVRGALEGGVSVVATYPGTPSSEIGNVFSKIAKAAGVYFEFSTNEKVAVEVAAAAAASNLRSFAFMKHVGLNVAADSFMSAAYLGVNAGMVVLTADDPSMYSSQNEQDNRIYARLAGVPLLEPSNPQEVKDFMKDAFDISEALHLPVLFRTTTRVSHMRGVVKVGNTIPSKGKGFFEKAPNKYVPVPQNSRRMHGELIEKLKKAEEMANESKLNRVFDSGNELAIITSGGAFNYVMDIVNENNLPVKILKLGFSYPFPEELVLDFIKGTDKVLIVEEVEPVMEKEVLALIGREKLSNTVYGKLDGSMPRIYEYTPDIIKRGILAVLGKQLERKTENKSNIPLPSRPPVLCPGCPHRATYFAVKKAIKELGIDENDVVFPSDIGCYTLGVQPPYETADFLLSMGASIGTGTGFAHSTKQKVIAFIGDSTFFHAGLPPLVNAMHNKANMVVVVLDNRTTAMTGRQPSPSEPVNGMGEVAPEISIADVVKGIGVEFVKTVDPYNLKNTESAFKEALQREGLSVIIAKHPCALITDGEKRKKNFWVTFKVNQGKCTRCKVCITELACPSFFVAEDGSVHIDPLICDGCGVCTQVCPEHAIEVRK